MAKVQRITDQAETEISYMFGCPGCGHHHPVLVQAQREGAKPWQFNGDLSRPTFYPSLKFEGSDAGVPYLCHSYVTDGRIRFLGDCTHALAGKAVELPDIE